MPEPLFSIVIPVYNRPREITRAIDSCLGQRHSAFEIIVVDDGSDDGTVEVVRGYTDQRVRLLCHETNQGVCPARNTGVDGSRGEWIIFLDSDDEFAPDALNILHDYVDRAPVDVARIASMCQGDDGALSPEPWTANVIMDYEIYIKWAEIVGRSDFNNCIRRTTFQRVRLPVDRAYETLYHLDFAKEFRTLAVGAPVVLVHSDAHNRVANQSIRERTKRSIEDAGSAVTGFEDILSRHGAALQRWAPSRFRMFSRALITSRSLAGQYRHAFRGAVLYLCRYPTSPDAWILFLLGGLGPDAFALGKVLRARYRTCI